MRIRALHIIAPALFALSACGTYIGAAFAPDRSFFETPISASAGEVASWDVVNIRVDVPETLRVSTDPRIRFPAEQIVWYGEPQGDRRAQVQAIMADGLRRGTAALSGPRNVTLAVRVNLFHAVTPTARSGGAVAWHDVSYAAEIRDASTGQVLAANQNLSADLKAFQGEDAVKAEAEGQTQKVRITEQIARSIDAWLKSSQS